MFVGRDDDLAVLQEAWQKAKAGKPQVVAVIAESGLGKTRLIQEFYSWLSTSEDAVGGEGYWPDQLARIQNASEKREMLLLNPGTDACVMDGRNVPFLWWGIGLPNTGGDTNSVTTSLTQYETRLQPHLLAYINAVRVSELKLEHAKSAGSTAVSLGLNYAEKILPHLGMAALAGLTFGMAGPAYALMGAIKDVGSAGWEARKRQQEIDRLDSRNIAAAGAVAEKHKDIADQILGNLAHVCNVPPKPLAKLPLVLVVDDAQWIRADLSLCKLLSDLLVRAGKQNWPVLVLVTSWEAEWRAAEPITWGDGIKQRISEVFAAQSVNLQELFLQPAERLEDVVAAAFPGLTESQSALVLSKAEGNALRLYNVLSYLEGTKQLFEGRDIEAPLSEQGEQAFAAESFDAFIVQRLQSTPEYVQAALGIASLQGMQFSAQAVAAAARNIQIANADRGLTEGENPHAFIKSAAAELAEFRAEYYQRAADGNLANLMDREEAARALEAALANLTANTANSSDPVELSEQWQAQLALFDSDDVQNRTVAFEALYRLAEKAYGDADYLATRRYATRWAEEWLGHQPGNNSTYVQQCIIGYLAELGQSQLAMSLSETCLEAIRANRDGFPESYVANQLQWALLIAGDGARALGDFDIALSYFNEGSQLSTRLASETATADNLHYVSLFGERLHDLKSLSDPADSLQGLEDVLETKRGIIEQRPDFRAYDDLATILSKLAKANLQRGLTAPVAQLVAELNGVVEKLSEMEADIGQTASHAARLHGLGDIYRLQSRHPEARELFHRALEKSWRAAEQLKTPQARRTLSLILERLALVAEAEGKLDLAISYLLSCMEIKDELLDSTDGFEALNDKVIIANKLVQLFAAKRDYRRSVHFAEEAIKVNAVHVERGLISKEHFAQLQGQVIASTAVLLAKDDGVDVTIAPWQPPTAWFDIGLQDIPRDTPRNSICPCGSGERFKHCHGRY